MNLALPVRPTSPPLPLPTRRRAIVRRAALGGVLALSATLDVHRLSQNGYANIFYSAGVKSMLVSLHNFLFVSFDPGGLMSVDKPPFGLWVQAASAKAFGFSPLSLLLPEAIAGVLAVGALYWALARPFGSPVALAAALALAVFPSFVAVARDNNLDATLILLMVLACGLALRAIESGRWLPLVACAALIGLAFNTKTLAAYLVVPGIAVAYLVCAPGARRRRASRLLAAGAVLLAVSFAWIALVEATPASQRPYVGGSLENTELGLTFQYNGFGRVEGQVGGPVQAPGAAARSTASHPPVLPSGRFKHPVAFGGATGPLRLWDFALGDQGGWLLPLSLLGLLALALSIALAGPPDRESAAEPPDRESAAVAMSFARARRRDPRLAALGVFGGWFAVEGATLSFSKGIVHPYYISALGPGAAAMAGVAAGACATLIARRDKRVALPCGLLLAATLAATVLVQRTLLDRAHYLLWLPVVSAGAVALGVAALLAWRGWEGPSIGLAFCALLLAPAAYSATTWKAPVDGTFPAAGPQQTTGHGGFGVSPSSLRTNRALFDYVRAHRPGTRWTVLTDASDTAAPQILLGGRAGSLGGYSGTDPALDGPGLARLVARGEARYVALGGAYAERGGNRATHAVERACVRLPTRAWHGRYVTRYSLILYDCAGRARQLARAPVRSQA